MIFNKNLFSDEIWRIVLSEGRYTDKIDEMLKAVQHENPEMDIYVWLVKEHKYSPITVLHSDHEYDILDSTFKALRHCQRG